MDHIKIVQRALEMTWRYRALWLFGAFLALKEGGGGGGSGGGNSGATFGGGDGGVAPPGFEMPMLSTGAIVAIVVGVVLFILLLVVASAVLRYVAENALIQMVNDHEETGEKRSVKQGFRLGWSRAAWRMFLIDLLIGLPVTLVFILLFALALSPLLVWITRNQVAGVIASVAAVGLFFLVIMLAVVVGVILDLLGHFFFRVCALEGKGVFDSIRGGYRLALSRVGDVGIMWLIMAGIGLAWGLINIPIVFALLILAGLTGGLPALLVGGVVAMLTGGGAAPWIVGALIGLPIFIIVLAVPSLFLGGLFETFKSTNWTLTYRELRALAAVAAEEDAVDVAGVPVSLPQIDAPRDAEDWRAQVDDLYPAEE